MNNTHPCANKCSEFKEGGQCFHCLINQTTNQGVYAIGRINLRQDDTPMATRTVEFKEGDCVVFKYNYQPHLLMTIEAVLDGGRFVGVDGYRQAFAAKDFRHATTQEIQANKRLNHIVEPNDMVDDAHIDQNDVICAAEASDSDSDFVVGDMVVKQNESWLYRVYVIHNGVIYIDNTCCAVHPVNCKHIRHATAQEIAAGGRLDNAQLDIGDDTHIENHISPLCKTTSQKVLVLESDKQIIERLKAENKMLHEAAATHLRNQNHFMDLYNRLVEQLYPYALDLGEPVDGDVNITPPEFTNGYNLARECAHYNLLEMMESDVEYIKAQCGMLGGGGGAV